MVAWASLVLDDLVEVKNFKIFNGSNGLFVSAPSKKSDKQDENGKDIYYNDVRFLGDKPEGVWQTDFQKEVFAAMVDEFTKAEPADTRATAAKTQAGQGTQGGYTGMFS